MTPAKGKTEAQDKDPAVEAEELREEIEETRAELGDTVEKLSEKADVKAQAQAKVDETKQQAQAKVDEAKRQTQAKAGQVKENPAPVAAIAGGIAALVLLLWIVRRR